MRRRCRSAWGTACLGGVAVWTARHGRPSGTSGDGRIVVPRAAGRRPLPVLGRPGAGKSTLLLNLTVQDVRAGGGVVVIEPKGDLTHAVVERIPPSRLGDVVLLNPADVQQPIGL